FFKKKKKKKKKRKKNRKRIKNGINKPTQITQRLRKQVNGVLNNINKIKKIKKKKIVSICVLKGSIADENSPSRTVRGWRVTEENELKNTCASSPFSTASSCSSASFLHGGNDKTETLVMIEAAETMAVGRREGDHSESAESLCEQKKPLLIPNDSLNDKNGGSKGDISSWLSIPTKTRKLNDGSPLKVATATITATTTAAATAAVAGQ
ncbi:hypothetical protein RFI_39351, partial [Reticulomyxa filosa]